MRSSLLSCLLLATGGAVWVACFSADVAGEAFVGCRTSTECTGEQVCLLDGAVGLCVASDTACIVIDDRFAVPDVNGTACAVGRICVGGRCVEPRCGDGVIFGAETCDGEDGCRTDCTRCGDGVIDSSEQCDNGASNSDVQQGACRTTCVPAACGDGVRDPGEECDDGAGNNDVDADACRTDCVRASCGDGVIDQEEECDDGNAQSGDGCRGDCQKVEACGDAVVDDGEDCDDGNGNPRDGCAACRTQAWRRELFVGGTTESRLATEVGFNAEGVAVDVIGRVVIATGDVIRRIDLDGTITTIAGTGEHGFSDDGGAATNAKLLIPRGLVIDTFGNVLFADSFSHRIRRIGTNGTITTVAGTGVAGFSGDSGPATSARLSQPFGLAIDPLGRLLIVDQGNHRVRRVDQTGQISTIAGTGVQGFAGDGGRAIAARFDFPTDIAVDPLGRILIRDNNRIRRIDLDGRINTIAGTGEFGGVAGAEGAAATTIALGLTFSPSMAVDPNGRIVFADGIRRRVRRIEEDGRTFTIVGGDQSGEGVPATEAALGTVTGVAVDASGRIVVVEARRVRRVDNDGRLRTIAGTGFTAAQGYDRTATSSPLFANALAVDLDGSILIPDLASAQFLRLSDDLVLTPTITFQQAKTPGVSDLVFDDDGRMVYTDTICVRRLEADGSITLLAGFEVTVGDCFTSSAFRGDGRAAAETPLGRASYLAFDPSGRLLISDSLFHRVLRIEGDGTLVTIAGNGDAGFSGDGGPATTASLNAPAGIVVDNEGRVVVADSGNNRIRRIEFDGRMSTIAGTGTAGVAGDGGLAVAAELNGPGALAVDDLGRIVLVDANNARVRRLEADGTIVSLVAPGASATAGDGGPATDAWLSGPTDCAIDDVGRVLFVDFNKVRRIEFDGTLTTLAGPVHPPGPGLVDHARLYPSAALVAVDDRSIISVGGLGRALRIGLDVPARVDVVIGYDHASSSAFGQARYAPLLDDARGVVVDPVALTLLVTEHDRGDLRVIELDPDGDGVIDAPGAWTNSTLATDLDGPAGIVYDQASDTFVVAEEEAHCVSRIGRDGVIRETLWGRCATAGVFPGFLHQPTHVAVSPTSGALHIADTGNHRVLRVQDDAAAVVIGDGSVSSAGDGTPARLFPVNSPGQLAFDSYGNLYVASTTTVRLVANIDGDNDADGDDRVTTIFGGGARETFPESSALCVAALTVGEDDAVYVADACQGFVVRLSPTTGP